MRAKLTILALASAALIAANGGTVQADIDTHGDDEHLLVVDLDSRKDLLIARCDGGIAQAEQIREDAFIFTCGRSIDDNDRVKGQNKSKK